MKIKRLYRIEAALRTENASPEQRIEQRRDESRDILDEIKEVLDKERFNYLPQSLTGKAISYNITVVEVRDATPDEMTNGVENQPSLH